MVFNSTIRAGLSPCRTLKLVPDMRFGAELAANFSRFPFIGLSNGADFLVIKFFQLLASGLIGSTDINAFLQCEFD